MLSYNHKRTKTNKEIPKMLTTERQNMIMDYLKEHKTAVSGGSVGT